MEETITFAQQSDFNQYLIEKIVATEEKVIGIQIILNAMANEIRAHDPQLAGTLAEFISNHALETDLNPAGKQAVEKFVQVLMHELAFDKDQLQ